MSGDESPDTGADAMAAKDLAVALPYSLFDNPPHLAELRPKLFDPREPLRLSPEDFEKLWPFVDNIYTTLRSIPSVTSENSKTDFYPCRIRQSLASLKDASPSPKPEEAGRQNRRKRQRVGETCPMVLKVTTSRENEDMVCTVERSDPNVGHSHDIDASDQFKRNTAIMDVARKESVKGFAPISVFNQMQAETDNMLAAGGKYMKISDVRNSTIKWRAENPDVILRTHEGAQSRPRRPRQPRYSAVSANSENQFHLPLPPETLRYPPHAQTFLREYLPHRCIHSGLPFITLTYATSLDSRVSIAQSVRTVLSGPESKAMTHFLRSKHDGILIGVGTAMADNPGLNCRLEGVGGYGSPGLRGQPRPIIIDPYGRLPVTPNMEILKLSRAGRGHAPWIIVAEGTKLNESFKKVLRQSGGAYLQIRRQYSHGPNQRGQPIISWYDIFTVLAREGLQSVMVEGGGMVLSELLRNEYRSIVASVIVTVAPTFLGNIGTTVAPDTRIPTGPDQSGRMVFSPIPNRLSEVKWQPMGNEDVILCGKLAGNLTPGTNGEASGMLHGIEQLAQESVQGTSFTKETNGSS